MKVGNTTFNIEGILEMSKQEFIDAHKGIDADLADIWDEVHKNASNDNTQKDTGIEGENKSSKRKKDS